MAVEIAEILEVGPGWNKVRGTDGNVYTLKGDYNWRSNNPGNIEYGPFAQSLGALGSGAVPPGRDRGFAIFPTLQAGEAARSALQFESPSYRDLSISKAISRYAPPSENNTQAYINAVTQAAGVSPDTRMSDLTPSQRQAFLEAQARVEGNMRQGDIINGQGIRLPPAEIPNVVASQLDVTPPQSISPRPATQSNALSSQRSLIPSEGSDALKSAMARLAGQSVRNVTPAMQSPDLAQMRNPIMSSSARNAQVTPYPATQSLDLAIRRAPGQTIDTIPTSGIGAPPATRSVQSVPMTGNNQSAMVEATRRAALMANPSYVERSPPVQNRPALVQDAARRAALMANQSYVGQDRNPPLAQARLAPGPTAQNYNSAINGPAGLTRQQFAALNSVGSIPSRQSAPMPLMASSGLQSRRAAPLGRGVNQTMAMLPQVRQAPQYGLPIASAPPLRVVVDGANVSGGQSAPMQISGFTNDGSGRLTSNETGGVYYERHLR